MSNNGGSPVTLDYLATLLRDMQADFKAELGGMRTELGGVKAEMRDMRAELKSRYARTEGRPGNHAHIRA